jgi:hypothetical protein
MAYKQTIRQLRERHKVYTAKLLKYGMHLASLEKIKDIERDDGAIFNSLAERSFAQTIQTIFG